MWKHYFLTSWRSLKRSRLFTCLNIFGLTVSMVGAILISLMVQNMVSWDRFHKEEDRLFEVNNRDRFDGELRAWSSTPKMLGAYMKAELPEVEKMTRLDRGQSLLFNLGEKRIQERGSIVDPDFFSMFSFPLVRGKVDQRWDDGDGLIITQDFAKTIFGKEDPIGKTVKVNADHYLTVSAVISNFPTNTFFGAPYFVSWEYARKDGNLDSSWGNNSVRTYVKLASGVNMEAFNRKISGFANKHSSDITTQNFIRPLSEVNLYSEQKNGKYVTGRIALVRTLLVIGILLLVIACINFMNLSTASSEKKAREVGVKKVIGATKKRLVTQFLVETMMIAFISFILALILAKLLLPAFDRLVDQPLKFGFNYLWWAGALVVVFLTGLLAGGYPALFLASFKPVTALKGRLRRVPGRFSLRAVLVVTQFSVAIVLILTTIMISRDVSYVQDRDRGYAGNGLAFSYLQGALGAKYEPFKNDLLASGAVTAVSRNMSPITQQFSNGWGLSWPGSTPEDDKTSFVRYSTDAGLIQTMGMQLVKGRDIDIYKYPSDSTAALLSETAVAAMRLKSPIGAWVKDNGVQWHVVGVIKDFIIDLPFDQIKPMIVAGPKSFFTVTHYRLNPDRPTAENLAKIKSIYEKYNPEYPFEYEFADDTYAEKFKETTQYGQLSMLFAGLTVFISCLGLFGLITYMAETKTKEIGIRKVLGASISGIIGLLSKGFLKLILLAYLIAIPGSLLIMHVWMSKSSYHVKVQAGWYLLTAVLTLVLVFVTVGFQALKAARVNPVSSLKTE